MPQQIVYTDEKEDKRIELFSKKWDLSKADTIKKIIREFKEVKNE
ncbi:MAG: hypothetical protein AABY22_08740 [Nanoarchaeota archaeon]